MGIYKKLYESRKKIYTYATKGTIATLISVLIYFGALGQYTTVEMWYVDPFTNETTILNETSEIQCEPCDIWFNVTTFKYSIKAPSVLFLFDREVNFETYKVDNRYIDYKNPKALKKFDYSGYWFPNESVTIGKMTVRKGLKESVKFSMKSGTTNIDPKLVGYTEDDFIPELIYNKADITGGEAVFEYCNPTIKNIDYDKDKLTFSFIKLKGDFNTFEINVGTKYSITKNVTDYFENITYLTTGHMVYDELQNITDKSGYSNQSYFQNDSIKTKWNITRTITEEMLDYKVLDNSSKTIKPKECKNILIKGTWNAGENISIDWIPETDVNGIKFKQEKMAWWNASWNASYPISLNTTTNLTDYQMQIVFNRSSCNANYSDFRITQQNGTLNNVSVPYWIESNTSTNATIWFKGNFTTQNLTNTYAWCGNPTATSQSNGSAVWDFFEDVSDNSCSKWTAAAGSLECSLGYLRQNTTTDLNFYRSAAGFNSSKNMRWSYDILKNTGTNFQVGMGMINPTTALYSGARSEWINIAPNYFMLRNSTHFQIATKGGTNAVNNTWQNIMVTNYNGNWTLTVNNTVVNSTVNTQWENYGFNFINIHSGYATINYSWDNIRIGKYISPEPTYSIGAELSNLDVGISLYLNGTSADRFYELGDPINITACANITGTTVFINTTHPSLTNPIANGTGCATYLWNYSTVVINTFNDSSTSQNHSANNISGVTIHSVTDLQSGSEYLRGYPFGTTDTVLFRFDEGAGIITSDYSSNRFTSNMTNMNLGINNGSSGWTSSGKFKTALNFDGTDDFTISRSSAYTTILNGNWTINLWVKTYVKNITGSFTQLAFGVEEDGYGTRISMGAQHTGANLGRAMTAIYDNTDTQYFLTASDLSYINDSSWHMLTLKRTRYNSTNSTFNIYVDGILSAMSQTGKNVPDRTQSYIIFGGSDAQALSPSLPTYNGTVDDVRIFNYTMTDAQVSNLYTNKTAYDEYPINLSIDIGNDGIKDYWLPYMSLQDTYAITDRFKTNSLIKNLTFSRSGTNAIYIQTPCNSQAISLSWNESGGIGTQTLTKVDNADSKSLVFSTENSSNTFNLYLPKSSTVLSAPVNITIIGNPYYSSADSLSGGYSGASIYEAYSRYKVASKPYGGQTITLSGGWVWCATDACDIDSYMKVAFVGDSGEKASCLIHVTGHGNYYVGGCSAYVPLVLNYENVWIVTSIQSGSSGGYEMCSEYAHTSRSCFSPGIEPNYNLGYFGGLNQFDKNNATNVTIWYNNSILEYQYLGELNSSNPKIINLSSTNMNSYLSTCTPDSCPISYTMKTNKPGNITIYDTNISFTNLISNTTFDVANDGVIDASITGNYIPNNNITIGSAGINAMNTYISGNCINNSVSIPIVATSETAGTMSLFNLVGNFSINSINLNISAMNLSGTGNKQVPIKYTADNWGILNTYGLSLNALTDYNYTFTGYSSTNNDTQTVKLIWSNYSLGYPNGVSYFRFKPSDVNATNVTPVGQSDTIPFFNITGFQREQPFDIYVKLNATLMSSVNFSVGNSSNRTFDYMLTNNNTFVKIISNISRTNTSGLWFWQDYYNVNTTLFRYWKWTIGVMAKCSECV